jgi:2-methylcitrate dehydratase PrpD
VYGWVFCAKNWQLTERLVEYAQALSYEELPPEVVERTKCLLLDTVGCALGAAPWQAPSIARALAGPVDVFAGKGGFFQYTGSRFELLPLGGQHGTPFCLSKSPLP